ncbi:DUF2934 domain-containing protein [Methylobacterium sp. E-066]|uniref:DUF2934 domain-containing protein n=1 Tax=Methylobacterium sp. E-066 TaxID=2836584 RepID=UPI001FB9BBEE|nr:DUF2934 domain-containing protein [Methylobacterium sp. E-066]MCJ2139403.1 DUF2934 domain-containing protein [Methylobacterium sp. E-066]
MEPTEALSSDLIREHAYDLWGRHYRPEGYELQVWFMAERELKVGRRAKVEPSVATELRAST